MEKVIKKGVRFTEVPEATPNSHEKNLFDRLRKLRREMGYIDLSLLNDIIIAIK